MKRSLHLLRLTALLPLVVGVCGFVLLEEYPFLDSLFRCVTMYVLNYGEKPPNFLVEIARWTAPLATASGVVLTISSLHNRLAAQWKYLRYDSVAVYGPAEETETMLALLGPRGIRGQDKPVKARRYILLDEETKNFSFYRAHLKQRRNCKVYIKCASLPAQSVSDLNLKLFCPEEIAARLFWRQRDVYSLWKESNPPFTIVMIGFGKLGEELLRHGLQNNLFAVDQRLEYHVFGDGRAFLGTHTELDQISDPVVWHEQPWYSERELLERAGLVLVLQQQAQTALLQQLLATTLRREIDVFASGDPALELLDQRDRMRVFAWKEQAMDVSQLFEDALYLRAKRINLKYCCQHGDVPASAEVMEEKWAGLDTFTRYSNVSAADYHEQRLKMLRAQGLSVRPQDIPPSVRKTLAELEHIRWCRYHYLNNWRYGMPKDGMGKDPAHRIHRLLCPYSELTPEQKEANWKTVEDMLEIE